MGPNMAGTPPKRLGKSILPYSMSASDSTFTSKRLYSPIEENHLSAMGPINPTRLRSATTPTPATPLARHVSRPACSLLPTTSHGDPKSLQ